MLQESHVNRIYKRLKKDINRAFLQNNITRVFNLIDSYADIAQRINNIFRDNDIELILQQIGEQYKPGNEHIDTNNNRIVFYDQIGSTICLGLQYIRGLIANGYKILYIFESPIFEMSDSLRSELTANNIEIFTYNSRIKKTSDSIKLINSIQKCILDFNPSKLIIHSPAGGALGNAVLYSLTGITKYRIVPGDHHFYIGYNNIDYFIEFRDFGVKVAAKERGLLLNQIYKLQYYPIVNEFIPFKGFPIDITNKICFAAAGAPYKFHGSDWFFKFAKKLLDKYENAIIFFMGAYTNKTKKFIDKENLKDRFVYLGYRKDFVACINHVDILINSYPWSGGLVCQTAAYFKKPIIAYTREEYILQDAIIDYEPGNNVSYFDEEKLFNYIDNLICDKEFREAEGNRINSILQTKENFDKQLGLILNNKTNTTATISDRPCSLSDKVQIYISLQNNLSPSILGILMRTYNLFILPFKMPFLTAFLIKNMDYIIHFTASNVIKRLSSNIHKQIKSFIYRNHMVA